MTGRETTAFFYEIFHAGLPRLGPGEDAATERALETLLRHGLGGRPRGSALRILDVGCGNGAPTIQVAKRTDCEILAIDNHQPYLDELLARAEREGVAARIRVELADMARLELAPGSFDLLWSEGALYNVGFLDGLVALRPFLVSEGSVAVSELCWFDDEAPSACREFFATEYPDMRSAAFLVDAIGGSGYEVLDHFPLPESGWWSYYRPLEERLEMLRNGVENEPGKLAILDSCRTEIEVYRRYSKHYGYEFFLLRRRDGASANEGHRDQAGNRGRHGVRRLAPGAAQLRLDRAGRPALENLSPVLSRSRRPRQSDSRRLSRRPRGRVG